MIPISKLRPVDVIPFRLKNIEPFIDRQHPKINPELDEQRYFDYWETFGTKCMQGLWGEDRNHVTGDGGFRFMTPDLFFYTNCYWIEKENLDTNSAITDYPDLRDIDWYVFYGIAEADGFSGFENDKYYTSNYLVKKIEEKKELSGKEKKQAKMYEDFLKTPDGKWKKYIGPKEYLYRTFDKPMGKALWHNDKKDMLYLTTRRLGKSYHGISIGKKGLVFNGARTMREYYSKKTKFISVFGSFDDKYTKENYRKLWNSYDMLQSLGAYKDDLISYQGAFWFPLAGSEALGGSMTNRVREKGGKGHVGWGSVVGRVSYKVNISSGVGYAGNYYWNEEVGLWDTVEAVHKENRPAQERETKFGKSIYGGTGGQLKKVKNVRKPFYNPSSMDLVEYPDIYLMSGRNIALFVPAQYRQNWHRDEHGNLDHVAAFNDEIEVRKKEIAKGGASSVKHVASFPMTHQDIFMQASTGNLPVEKASERLSVLVSMPDEDKNIKTGTLHWDENAASRKVFFRSDDSLPVLRSIEELESASEDLKRTPITVIYEPPILDKNALYFSAYDNVRYDEGASWAIGYVFKIFGPKGTKQMNIVARTLCRMAKRESNDKEILKLAMFYQCGLLPETNVPSCLSTAELLNLYDMLIDCPIEAYRTIANVSMKHDKGWYTTPGTKDGLEVLAGEYLNTIVDQYITDKGDIIDILMIDQVDDELFLDNVIFYNKDGNYDAMSAFFGISLKLKQYSLEGGYSQHVEVGNNSGQKLMSMLAKASKSQNRVFKY